ncbi:S-adenosyl-L-methionine-dependent methyltransferase [Thamnocephalis sphaerospora]|uniref:S-adenosyl-L-methionine-dependent methyltransferase n=1 Tax=Thamnocephalis sphaerospora TaxID=78915 RepID=A0A4P9XKQ0_9FUNG|nr:S-adenosyl-L-methionine-dependent methyltransferase [Thamnocephalis sphaerospora]|eukprot:RKP06345.1 S-adenosyl-L-methionine-dependent methyltransferase [Thamnocephalis sphaerospora]
MSGSGSGSGSGKTAERFAFTDGRRYHNEPNCPYPLPNDLEEVDRLEIQHYAIQQITRKRYHALLYNPKRAIDIGAGTGIWLMEMATDFPECEFTGIDIAPLQPTTILPQNCTFEMANVLEGLSHPDGYFDYVRHCLLVAAIPKDKWLSYVKECARLCASGGWVEMIDSSGRIHGGGPACQKISNTMSGVLKARGLSPETTETLDVLMREAGLVDVEVKEFRMISGGSRGGSAGKLFLKDFRMGCNALAPLLVNMHGMAREDVDQLILQAEQEMEQCDTYGILRIFVGRKP